jgi:hypothetical protein
MATIMPAAGVHPKVVQERLSHKSIQMALDRYSHVSMTMQRDAAAVIDQLLAETASYRRNLPSVVDVLGSGYLRLL